jgi:2-amino-4-hydroxy-6-hydroxymethyldihydropteridine diphosphokinase
MRETEPFGVTDQPRFLNQVVAGRWAGSPKTLLDAIKAAEKRVGREPGRRWGPRVADADILLFGDLVLNEPELVIPHPGIAERRFVLEPLAELAPELRHPVLGRSIGDLLRLILESER